MDEQSQTPQASCVEAPSPPFTEVAAEVTLQKEVGGGSGSGAWKTTLPQTQNPVLVRGLSWHFVLSLRSGSPVLAETSQGAPRKGSGSG